LAGGHTKSKGIWDLENMELTRSKEMDRCMGEVWEAVEELPGHAQDIWSQAFREALLEVQGDESKAAAMAWRAFKGEDPKKERFRDRERAAKGLLIVSAYGGTPEWIKFWGNEGLVLDDDLCPCLVDRKALEALVVYWEQLIGPPNVHLDDVTNENGQGPVVGWIKKMQCNPDGLWVKVEWTEEGLGYISRKEFCYLGLGFILDESNRPVELWQARLTNNPDLHRWLNAWSCHREKKGYQNEIGGGLRLIKRDTGKTDLEDTPNNLLTKDIDKNTSFQEVRQFLQEMRQLLHLRGYISLAKVKTAVVKLKAEQENSWSSREEDKLQARGLIKEVSVKTIEEAVKKGLIKPEQRTWAEVKASQDWSEFKEFLNLADTASKKYRRKRWLSFPFIRSLAKWACAKNQEDH
jgi:hypothetical protein